MRQTRYRGLLGVIVCLIGLAAPSVALADETDLPFDIYRVDSCLIVWVDLAGCLSSKAVDRLKEGVDLAFECDLRLTTPRRLFGSRTVTEFRRVLRTGYRRLTDDYILLGPHQTEAEARRFLSLAELYQFARDSIEFCVALPDSLDSGKRYRLQGTVTAVSLTDFNLAADGETDSTGGSPIKYLFKQFLDVTSYGRREYTVESALFALSELKASQ